jgi:hypothetical protein
MDWIFKFKVKIMFTIVHYEGDVYYNILISDSIVYFIHVLKFTFCIHVVVARGMGFGLNQHLAHSYRMSCLANWAGRRLTGSLKLWSVLIYDLPFLSMDPGSIYVGPLYIVCA